jgi:hypothetical protein
VGTLVQREIFGRLVAPGHFLWKREVYEDLRVLTPLSVFQGVYARGLFQDIRVRRVASRLRSTFFRVESPLWYLEGQYIVFPCVKKQEWQKQQVKVVIVRRFKFTGQSN